MEIMDNQDEFPVRDNRGSERSFFDNSIIRDYGKLIGSNCIAVYNCLAMFADDKQKCHPSIQLIADLIVLSKPTVIEDLKILEWLNIIRKIRVGKTCTNRYVLIDKKKWRKDWGVMLNELTTDVVKQFNFTGKLILLQRLNHLTSNSNNTQKKQYPEKQVVEASSTEAFFWKEYLSKMHDDKQRHIQVIALYFSEKKLKFENLEETQVAIRRHLVAARKLSVFKDDTIIDGIERARKKYPDVDWTLETVIKVLTS